MSLQAGAGTYSDTKDLEYTNAETRKAYATTVFGNMVLLSATGAVPGAEVSGGHKLFSKIRLGQFLKAGVTEAFEET
jgi:hypothetical protein